MTIKLVVFDLDLTLWSHHNVSSLIGPLKKTGPDCVEDSSGSTVTLFLGVRSVLRELEKRGKVQSIASWNDPAPVHELLRLFEINQRFTYPQVEWYRPKVEMLRSIIRNFNAEGTGIRPSETLFVDDSQKHLSAVQKAEPEIRRAQAWTNPTSPEGLLTSEWLG